MKIRSLRMLPFLRGLVAAGVLLAMAALFLVPAVACRAGWLPRWQLVPAVLAGAWVELAVLALVLALFGRLYCSVACPLGLAQDLVRAAFGWALPKRAARPSSRAARYVRHALLVAFVAAGFCGFTALLDPYGIFGRFLSVGLRRVGEPSSAAIVWALALFAVVMALALVRARWWCNRVCPVGTLLGLFARHALFRVRIGTDACVGCGRCARRCDKGALTVGADGKAAADASQCVVCGACAGCCPTGALGWRPGAR